MSKFLDKVMSVVVAFGSFAVLFGCSSEPSSEKDPKDAMTSAIPGAYTGAFSAWDSLEPRLMPAWGISSFWEDNLEECVYYEARMDQREKSQFESVIYLKREALAAMAGAPSQRAWHFRCEPGDSLWPKQEGWFSVQPFPQPRAWSRVYEEQGAERFGNPETGAPYSARTWTPAQGDKASAGQGGLAQTDLELAQGILLADQLPFLLRNLAFTPGKSLTCLVYPLPRRGMVNLSAPLKFTIKVEKPETVAFQGEEFPCWLVTLNAADQVVEKFWFNRNYPNVMVRWENMIGESKMLKYVRYSSGI